MYFGSAATGVCNSQLRCVAGIREIDFIFTLKDIMMILATVTNFGSSSHWDIREQTQKTQTPEQLKCCWILTRVDGIADNKLLMTEGNYDDVYCKMWWRHHFAHSTTSSAAENNSDMMSFQDYETFFRYLTSHNVNAGRFPTVWYSTDAT